MRHLILPPDGFSLTGSRQASSVAATLNSPQGFYAPTQRMQAWRVEVSWTCSLADFDYFMAFWRTATARGALPFTVDLPLESAELTTHVARFVPGSIRLADVQGTVRTVRAAIDVVSLEPGQFASSSDAVLAALLPAA